MGYFWDVSMSVINQMLKDLDKRQNDQQDAAKVSVPLPAKSSTSKLILVIVAIIIIVNVIGIFGWQLYSENQQLKSQAQLEKIASSVEPNTTTNEVNRTSELSAVPTTMLRSESKVIDIAHKGSRNIATPHHLPTDNNSEHANTVIVERPIAVTEQINLSTTMPEIDDTVVIVAPVEAIKNIVSPQEISEPVSVKSSLTISRSQLSPQELAANKITQAEQAMERHDIAKAESLFEEILLVMPAHETARKQLAALWYGKKYYQDAVNLLSQGIALAPQAEEMRLMSARIYYEQGQARQAFNILNPINRSNSTEVQTLLANISAELNEHESAITAYRQLITLEPNVGRWWLGMAVSLDSLGKFLPARDAYKQSIARNNLSTSAMQFARQRLIELGE
jgi:MSHA biogenesis protein MshN